MNQCFAALSFSREPAMYVALADALIVVAVHFGVPIDANLKVAIDGVIIALSGVLVRSQVTPTGSITHA